MAFNFWREFDRGDKAVIVLMVFFFLITSYLGYFNHGKFNSPDESANYFFAKNFALKTSLSVPEPLDLVAPIVHPRSVNVRGSDLVPGSFIGLILFYGHVAKVFGSGAIVFLTPFFASLALGAWYWIIKKLAGQSLAFTSSVIWAIHPALLYYAARGLLPNVLFVSALVLMVFCYLRAGGSSRWWIWAILAGAFFSLAVGVRANEIIWLLPLIVAVTIYFRRVIHWKVWLTFAVSSIIFITPVLYWQEATFGAVFKTGYQSQVAQVVSAAAEPQVASLSAGIVRLRQIKSYVLPLGLNFKLARQNGFDYLVKFFWWLSLPTAWVMVWLIKNWRKHDRNFKFYLVSGLALICWLMVYYGSHQYNDTTLQTATIGTSYIRYLLPSFLWLIPLIALALNKLPKLYRIFVLLIMAGLGLNLTFFSTPESLVPVHRNIAQYEIIGLQVYQMTEPDAVIITYRTDKIFFPGRRVIHYTPPDYSYLKDVAQLLTKAPVYFFTMLPADQVEVLNGREAGEAGLKLEKVNRVSNFDLYRIKLL